MKKLRKKGFTLTEIVVSVILLAGISYYLINYYNQNKWYNRINESINKMIYFTKYAVLDPNVGYANNTDGNCSNDYNFEDISSKRVKDCYTQFVKTDFKLDKNEKYLYSNLLNDYSSEGIGCKLYYGTKSDDNNILKIFIDCSTVKFDNKDRNLRLLENKIETKFKNSFADIFYKVERKAESLDDKKYKGKDNDGKILVILKI